MGKMAHLNEEMRDKNISFYTPVDSSCKPTLHFKSVRRILVIVAGPFSGISESLISALRSQGCEVVVATHTLRVLRFRVFYVGFMVLNAMFLYGKNFWKYKNNTPLAFWVRSRANQKIAKQHQDVDMILTFSSNLLTRGKVISPHVRIALFTDHTNMLSKNQPNYGYQPKEKGVHSSWNRVERKAYNEADFLFVMGSHVRTSMIKDYGVLPERVIVVGGGPNLDLDAERDLIEKNYIGKNILFVGLEGDRKGLPLLLSTFKQLRPTHPDARLHIVGIDGESAEGIHYHGKLYGEGLKTAFYNAQIFVLPTYREPFGIVFLEAMWAKNVCIGTRIGAIPEIIHEEVNGLLIAPGDKEALVESLDRLLNSPGLVREMAEAGHKTAKSRWSWDKVADTMLLSMNSIPSYERQSDNESDILNIRGSATF